jgi:hypothetical protein
MTPEQAIAQWKVPHNDTETGGNSTIRTVFRNGSQRMDCFASDEYECDQNNEIWMRQQRKLQANQSNAQSYS